RDRRAGGACADRARSETRSVLRRVVRGGVAVLPGDRLTDAHRRGIGRERLISAIADHRDGDVRGDRWRGRTRTAAAAGAGQRRNRCKRGETDCETKPRHSDLRKRCKKACNQVEASAVPRGRWRNREGMRGVPRFGGTPISTIRVNGYVMCCTACAKAAAEAGACSR